MESEVWDVSKLNLCNSSLQGAPRTIKSIQSVMRWSRYNLRGLRFPSSPPVWHATRSLTLMLSDNFTPASRAERSSGQATSDVTWGLTSDLCCCSVSSAWGWFVSAGLWWWWTAYIHSTIRTRHAGRYENTDRHFSLWLAGHPDD